jgi:hypothetical protein
VLRLRQIAHFVCLSAPPKRGVVFNSVLLRTPQKVLRVREERHLGHRSRLRSDHNGHGDKAVNECLDLAVLCDAGGLDEAREESREVRRGLLRVDQAGDQGCLLLSRGCELNDENIY